MVTVAKLNADLTANTSQFESGMSRARSTLNNTARDFAKFGNKINQLGGYIGAGGLAYAIKSQINAMDDMAKAADRIGISTESFSKLKYAGDLADVSMEDLEKTIRSMQKAITEGADAAKGTSNAFTTLGISAKELINLSPDDAMIRLVDALNKIENPTRRNALAMEVFGKSGLKLINFAKDGSKGLREIFAEAERLGIVLKDDTARAAEKFNDALTRLGAAIKGAMVEAADTGALETMAQSLEVLLDVVLGVTKAYGDMLRVFGAEFTAKDTIDGVKARTQKELDFQRKNLANQLDPESFGSKVTGVLQSPEVRTKNIERTRAEIERLQTVLQNTEKYYDKDGNIAITGTGGKAKGVAEDKGGGGSGKDAFAEIIKNLQKESAEVDIQVSMYGKKEAAIARAKKELEIQNQLTAAGITLTKEQQAQIDTYLESIERQSTLYDDLEKQQKKLEDQERDRQQALADLGNSFESAFEDAIISGEKLSDVLSSLLQDILRIAIRTQVTGPLVQSVGNMFQGGGFGDAISSILGFAGGTDFVPYDMTADIHRGERILTAEENRAFTNGAGTGGGDVIVNITNNTPANVKTSSSSGPGGAQLNVMIDNAVAENISRKGSKSNQALTAFNSRTLVRR